MTTTYLSRVDIADRLKVPTHRVRYLLAVYGIAPVVVVGKWPGYTEKVLERVRAVLRSDDRVHALALSDTEKH